MESNEDITSPSDALVAEADTESARIRVAVHVDGYAAHHGLPSPETEYDAWSDNAYYGALDDARTLERELAWAGPELDKCISAKDQEAAIQLGERISAAIASRPWLELRDVRIDDYEADDFWSLCWVPAGPSRGGRLAP